MKNLTETHSISIIIPTYNRLNSLKLVLPSYLKQKYLAELIIVDDASDDDVGAYICSLNDSRIIYIRHAKNQGLPTARNTGIHAAKNPFIMMGEDDLYFSDDYSEKLFHFLLENKADIVGGAIVFLRQGETFPEAKKRAFQNHKPYFNPYTLSFNFAYNIDHPIEVPFIHPLVLMKKEIAQKVLFDPIFLGSFIREETDFYFRAKKMGAKIFYVPDVILYHMPISGTRKGGCWNVGTFKYHYYAIRNNYIFAKRHFPELKRIGLKTSFFTFNLLHILNRFRIFLRSVL